MMLGCHPPPASSQKLNELRIGVPLGTVNDCPKTVCAGSAPNIPICRPPSQPAVVLISNVTGGVGPTAVAVNVANTSFAPFTGETALTSNVCVPPVDPSVQ